METILTKADEASIVEAIKRSEKRTSGEIRVHIENKCKNDALERAKEVFAKLDMHKTDQQNGVIIYLAVKDHKVAIWGDEGIHSQVGQAYWDDIVAQLIYRFKHHKYSKGLIEAIDSIGGQLSELFPYERDDVNELSDDISFHKN
jgi:uncharacterized membrane protein